MSKIGLIYQNLARSNTKTWNGYQPYCAVKILYDGCNGEVQAA